MALFEQINSLILQSTKNREGLRTEVLKSIKNAFLVFKTAKNAKPLTEEAEIQILKKLKAQRLDAAEQYKIGGRAELAEQEMKEAEYISEFLPKEMTEDEVKEIVNKVLSETSSENKNMGYLMKTIRSQYPNIDGKLLSTLIKAAL